MPKIDNFITDADALRLDLLALYEKQSKSHIDMLFTIKY